MQGQPTFVRGFAECSHAPAHPSPRVDRAPLIDRARIPTRARSLA